MLISKDLSLTRYSNYVREDGSVKLQWHVTSEGRVFLDKSPQAIILCSIHVKGYLESRDRVQLARVSLTLRRIYTIERQETFLLRLKLLQGRDIFGKCLSFLPIKDYCRLAVASRDSQVHLGNARLIRSVHCINPALPSPQVVCKTNLVALHAIAEVNKDRIAPHLVQFVRANLESLAKIVLKSSQLKQEDLALAILAAAQEGRAFIVKTLMGRISPLFRVEYLDRALAEAARNGHVHCLNALLDIDNLNLEVPQKLEIFSKANYSDALVAATENNRVKCVRRLRINGMAIRYFEKSIFLTADRGYLECFRILFGIPSMQSGDKDYILWVFSHSFERAFLNRHFDFLKGLLPRYEYLFHAKIDQMISRDSEGWRGFIKSQLPGNLLALMLKRDISSDGIKDALLLAVQQENLEHVQIFFRVRAEISKSMLKELIPIAKAGGNQELTEFLISQNEIG